jgi:hypothetical protein
MPCYRFVPLLVVALAAGGPLAAQAPVITPAGDPSVQSDTIYRLAVDSQDPRAAGQPFVYLLDDGVVRFEADGRGRRTYRQIVQILRPEGVENWAEQSFSYDPDHERLTVNWLRVVKPDGTVVSNAPTLAQDADVPAAVNAPVYTHRKVRRFSLSGVAPGTLVDFSYTTEELKPWLKGDFHLSWRVTTGNFTRRSRYLVDLPAGFTPNLVETNSHRLRSEQTGGGRRVYSWTAQDVPRVEIPLFAADSNDQYVGIEIGGAISWADLGRWYAGLARGRYAATPAVDARLKQLVAGARTLDDSLHALHRFVAQDVRYVSIALGLGGYQPRAPDDVLSTGYGDCKDKATLFIAFARRIGIQAYPVLLNAGGDVDRRVPAIEQFDHAIAVIERPSGRVYVDLTSELTPLGELPPPDQGQFALVVRDDGRIEEVTLPLSPPSDNLMAIALDGTLNPDGTVDGSYREKYSGTEQYGVRETFSTPLDAAGRERVATAIATKLYTAASGDSLQVTDGRDLRVPPSLSLRIRGGRAAKSTGGGLMVLELPITSLASLADVAKRLEDEGEREYPIDASKVLGPIVRSAEIRLTLPEGWRAQLPASDSVSGRWGRYVAHYTQEGQELRVTRYLEGTRGIYPPSDVKDLTEWLRALAQDDTAYLILKTK